MASWSTRRKYGIFFGLLVALAVLAGVPTFFAFYEAPTCSDRKQNGDERGIDCGGSCPKLCAADFIEPKVLWSYSMRIVPGIYNALAYIQNPNQLVESPPLSYVFRLYDKDGLYIAERKGRAFVPAGQKFAVFESAIKTGERVPAKTTFEFTNEPAWRSGEVLSKVRAESVDVQQTVPPKAEVVVKNDSNDDAYTDLDVYIILYDLNDNRTAFSKASIAKLGPGAREIVYFTWPEGFVRPAARSELLFVAEPN
jgi:hypothetical protein